MTTRKQKQRTATIAAEHMAYVGPSLSEGRLSFATVYIGDIPTHFSFDRKRTMVQTAFRAGL